MQVRLLRNDRLNPPRPRGLEAGCGSQAFRRLRRSLPQKLQEPQRAKALRRGRSSNALRGGEDWIDRRLRIPRRPPGPAARRSAPANHRQAFRSGTTAGASAPESRGGECAAARDEQFASQQLAEAEAAAGAAEAATAAEAGGGALALLVDSPTMHTQVYNPCRTSYNVTVARAFIKLLGAFVTFPDTDKQICSASAPILSIPALAASSRRLESQMQLGALQYPCHPVASDAEHFHFLEIL